MTLAEAATTTAIVALATGAILTAVLPAVRGERTDARDVALGQLVERDARAARDVLKYDGSSLVPATAATTIPLPGASPLPVTVQLVLDTVGVSTTITVTASTVDGAHTARAQAIIAARAPQPGRTFAPAGLVAQPTGAP
jgi:hypothetical protein